jgi:hypothetical protein
VLDGLNRLPAEAGRPHGAGAALRPAEALKTPFASMLSPLRDAVTV